MMFVKHSHYILIISFHSFICNLRCFSPTQTHMILIFCCSFPSSNSHWASQKMMHSVSGRFNCTINNSCYSFRTNPDLIVWGTSIQVQKCPLLVQNFVTSFVTRHRIVTVQTESLVKTYMTFDPCVCFDSFTLHHVAVLNHSDSSLSHTHTHYVSIFLWVTWLLVCCCLDNW